MFRVFGKVLFYLFTLLSLGAGVFSVVFFWGRGGTAEDIPRTSGIAAMDDGVPVVNEERSSLPTEGAKPEREPQDALKSRGASESVSISGVPFTVQAPFGEWNDPHFQNACEEASVIMVEHWRIGEALTPAHAKEEIRAMESFEERLFGNAIDTSAADTLKLFQEYYQTSDGNVFYDITADQIRGALVEGDAVIVPADGRKLKNPNFVPPGPTRHMLVVIGYDAGTKTFVTNDPGTRNGRSYRYSEAVLMDAIQDYPTGDHLPNKDSRKAMIVIPKGD